MDQPVEEWFQGLSLTERMDVVYGRPWQMYAVPDNDTTTLGAAIRDAMNQHNPARADAPVVFVGLEEPGKSGVIATSIIGNGYLSVFTADYIVRLHNANLGGPDRVLPLGPADDGVGGPVAQ